MIPETCILNNKHKLYVTLHHECNVTPDRNTVCQGCTYYADKQKLLMETYKAFLSAPAISINTPQHNMLKSIYNNSSASIGSLQANLSNQVVLPRSIGNSNIPDYDYYDDYFKYTNSTYAGLNQPNKNGDIIFSPFNPIPTPTNEVSVEGEEHKKNIFKTLSKAIKIIFKGGTL